MKNYLARVWFSVVSFISGAGVTFRALSLLALVFSLPISLPLILIVALIAGIKNASSQSNTLKQRDEALTQYEADVTRLLPLIEANEQAQETLQKNYWQAKQRVAQAEAEKNQLRELATRLEKLLKNIKQEMYRHGRADPKKLFSYTNNLHSSTGPMLTAVLANYEKANESRDNKLVALQHLVNSLENFTEQGKSPTASTSAASLINKHSPTVAIPAEKAENEFAEKKPGYFQQKWQTLKSHISKGWSVASVALGTTLLALGILHTASLLLALPTGGLSLAIGVGAAFAFGVGTAILYIAQQNPADKKLAQLKLQKSKLDDDFKQGEKKNSRLTKKAKYTNQIAEKTEQDNLYLWDRVKHSCEQFKTDLKIQRKSEPTESLAHQLGEAQTAVFTQAHTPAHKPSVKIDLEADKSEDDFVSTLRNAAPEDKKELKALWEKLHSSQKRKPTQE